MGIIREFSLPRHGGGAMAHVETDNVRNAGRETTHPPCAPARPALFHVSLVGHSADKLASPGQRIGPGVILGEIA